MDKVLKLLVVLLGLLFVVMGLRWVVDPAGAAAGLGMPLLEGVARSSQIADVGSFFLAMGGLVLVAVATARRSWYYVSALIPLVAAVIRLVAWQFHGAAFAGVPIAVEVVSGCLLLVAASRLGRG